ncbi:hypothetical protein WA026_008019 [Henosepilachna vigintioctopunctata]|uniref:Uncharacterized protein n=1 Tax=Henosepilachna vigintioctopunctata TaxID=420089 RepID=A0AAW1TQ07_9CUCU
MNTGNNKLNHSVNEIADLFAYLGELYFTSENRSTVESQKLLQLEKILKTNQINLKKLLRQLSPACKDIVQKCKWKEEEKICDTMFEKIITSEGHCCSFNYFAPRNHTFGG